MGDHEVWGIGVSFNITREKSANERLNYRTVGCFCGVMSKLTLVAQNFTLFILIEASFLKRVAKRPAKTSSFYS